MGKKKTTRSTFLASPMRTGGDLWLALIIAVAAALAALFPLPPLLAGVRVILGLGMVLIVPGYCLTAALFPYRGELDGIERAAVSIGVSLAVAPPLALLLDRLPWGVTVEAVVLGELAISCAAAGWAFSRRGRIGADRAYVPALSWGQRSWWRQATPREREIFGLLIGGALLAAALGGVILLTPPASGYFTEFYALGPANLAEEYPREVRAGEPVSLTLGIANHERGAKTYQVQVWASDPWTDGRRELLLEGGPYPVGRGEQRELPLTWRMPWAGDEIDVEILLFAEGGSVPYRSLRLIMKVLPPS